MPPQGRIGDNALVPADAHGCPACPHPAVGPGIAGSPNVLTNGLPSLRVGDPGIHAACCGPNKWAAKTGSRTVFINGRAAHRLSDMVRHCGGLGQLVEGSPNVIVGDLTSSGGGSGGTGAHTAEVPGGASGDSRNGGASSASGGSSSTGPGGSSTSGDSEPAQPAHAPADTWIEVELFDAAGEPVANAEYKIRTADGGVRQGTLNGYGSIHVEPLVHGTCQASFPRLDRREPGPLPPDAPPAQDLDAIAFTRRRVEPHEVETGASHRFQLRRLHGLVLEAEHFHEDSAVFLPCRDPQRTEIADTDITGIDVLRAAFLFQRDNPKLRALVTGHGTGQTASTDGFSLLRASSLYYLLIGNGPAWSQQSAQTQTLRDVQSILRWADELWAWECDPGPADGVFSETTKKAFDAFRSGYGEEFAQPMPAAMDELGLVGDDTFAIFFDLYQRALAVSLEIEIEALREWQTKWLWVSGVNPPLPVPADPKRAWLHIRRADSIWPVKMAEIAVHNARRYTELNPLNPQHVRPDGGGWKDLYAGDDIYIPPSWAQALRDAGYEIHEEGTDPEPVEPPLDDAIGCGEHHLVTPFREPVGRAVVRRGEVLFFGEGEVPRRICRDSATCDTGSCEVYDPREYEQIHIDVSHQALAIPSWIAISLRDAEGKPVGGERYILTLSNGQTVEDRLPNDGRAYYGPIPRGFCELEFPDRATDDVRPCSVLPPSQDGVLIVSVVDADGQAIDSASVFLEGPTRRQGTLIASSNPQGMSDSQHLAGTLKFSNLQPGQYTVYAHACGYASALGHVTVHPERVGRSEASESLGESSFTSKFAGETGETASTVSLVLISQNGAEGTHKAIILFRNKNSAPVTNVAYSIHRGDTDIVELAGSESTGEITVELASGTYAIHAQSKDSFQIFGYLKFSMGSPFLQHTVLMTDSADLTITVTADRKHCTHTDKNRHYGPPPIENAQVRLGQAVATTDENGKVAFKGIVPGTQQLRISRTGFSNHSCLIVVSENNNAFDIELKHIENEDELRQAIIALAREEALLWAKASTNAEAAAKRVPLYYRVVRTSTGEYYPKFNLSGKINYAGVPIRKGGMEWCGIFAVWVVWSAAVPSLFWKMGSEPRLCNSAWNELHQRSGENVRKIKPGDIFRVKDKLDDPKELVKARQECFKQLRNDSEYSSKTDQQLWEIVDQKIVVLNHHGIFIGLLAGGGPQEQFESIEGNTYDGNGAPRSVQTFRHRTLDSISHFYPVLGH